ncbi:tetratricopeptide repeat protein 21B, partial [Clonorchis sinensis]
CTKVYEYKYLLVPMVTKCSCRQPTCGSKIDEDETVSKKTEDQLGASRSHDTFSVRHRIFMKDDGQVMLVCVVDKHTDTKQHTRSMIQYSVPITTSQTGSGHRAFFRKRAFEARSFCKLLCVLTDMACVDQEVFSTVFYYLREGYPNHGRIALENGMKRYPHDDVLKFHMAVIFAIEGNLQEASKRFSEFKDKEDFHLASVVALAHAHKTYPEVDAEAVKEFEAKTRELRRHASSTVIKLTSRFDLQKDLVLRSLGAILPQKVRKSPVKYRLFQYRSKTFVFCYSFFRNVKALNLNGWIDMLLKDENLRKKAIRYFEGSTGDDEVVGIECQMGRAYYFQLSRSYSAALDITNILIVNFPKYIPAIIAKMHLQLISQDWEQAMDTSQRCLTLDCNCIEALKYQVLHALCHLGNISEVISFAGKLFLLIQARKAINELKRALDDSEPNYAEQYYINSKYFAPLCARDTVILHKLFELAERAASLDNRNHNYAINIGRIMLLQGRPKEASRHFQSALEFSETSVVALQGIVECQLAQDNVKEALSQLEFLDELQQTIGKSAELSYLAAVLGRKQSSSSQNILAKLDEATELHLKSLEGCARGIHYYEQMNPDFMIQLVMEYLAQAPQQPPGMTSISMDTNGEGITTLRHPEDGPLTRCLRILDQITTSAPGYQKALYLTSYVHYLLGDSMMALTIVKKCLDLDATLVDGHILLAQVSLPYGSLKLAEQALETGLSNNFEVRNHPLYQLVRARLLTKQGNAKAAVQILKQAISSLGSSQASHSHKRTGDDIGFGVSKAVSMNDQLTLSLELAEAHHSLGETHEATKVLQDAQMAYSGSPELGRITIASADLALSQGDHESALSTLRTIRPEHPYYLTARQHMANIYLHHRKEKKLYAACYRELADKLGTTEAHLLLGDAFMTIQEPERAMEVYETVLRKNPNDLRLAAKMGQALVKTHQYAKAVSYYEAAVKSGQPALRLDLVSLLVKLQQNEKAKRVLTPMMTEKNAACSLDPSEVRRALQLLEGMCAGEEPNVQEHIDLLTQVKSIQSRRLNRMQASESGDAIAEQRLVLAEICLQLACLNEKLYRALQSDRSLNAKEKVRVNDDLTKGDKTTTSATTVSLSTKHMESALALCRDCMDHVAAIMGKKNNVDSHQPLTLGMMRSHLGGETGQPRLLAIQLEIKALAKLASLKLLDADYASCEQQALRLAQLREEVEAYQIEALSDINGDIGNRGQTVLSENHGRIDLIRMLDGIKSASSILAELSYNKADFEAAAKHLENDLRKDPINYQTLSFLVDALRRAGQVSRAVEWVEKARALDVHGSASAGYNFCRGLCYSFTGESMLALQHFNRARLDSDFSEEAIYHMVDICLAAEYQVTYEQFSETGQATNSSNTASSGQNKMTNNPVSSDEVTKVRGFEVAENLLNELRQVKNRKKHLHRINMVLVATGSKPKVEAVLETFARMAQEDVCFMESVHFHAITKVKYTPTAPVVLLTEPLDYRQLLNVRLRTLEATLIRCQLTSSLESVLTYRIPRTNFPPPLSSKQPLSDTTQYANSSQGHSRCKGLNIPSRLECYKACTIGTLFPAATVSITGKRECGTYNEALGAKDSEELELSWLLLAEIYIKIGKTDLAQELLKRCLQYNKSCTKAYEFTGYVMEREQNFHEAARNYELAWNISNRSNPSVGYKLAHSRLKIRQLLGAIEVCLQDHRTCTSDEHKHLIHTVVCLDQVSNKSGFRHQQILLPIMCCTISAPHKMYTFLASPARAADLLVTPNAKPRVLFCSVEPVVLAVYPNYPRIKTDVLDKARLQLRT